MNKFLICEDGELLKNLPKLIKKNESKTIVISRRKSSLTKNKHVDRFIFINSSTSASFNDNLITNKNLISKLNGWIIWGNDEIMRRVATSNLPLKEKLRILPTKKKSGLVLLGSKAGQAEVANRLKLKTPKTVVAKNSPELRKYSSKFQTPFIVKADKYGGGAFIKKVSTAKEKKELSLPKEWYPVVIQKFIPGQIISIEAFFKDGNLIACIYSSFKNSVGEYGPSSAREYKNPDVLDFEPDLILLAKECGLHGMFNCTFILKDKKHYLIEADARPNSWQFLYAYFKLPILEIMSGEKELPLTPLAPNLKNRAVRIVDLARIIPYAVSRKDYRTILYSLVRVRKSTQWIAGKRGTIVLAVFSYTITPSFQRVRLKFFSYLVALFRAQPEKFQRLFKKLGLTRFIAFKIFRV